MNILCLTLSRVRDIKKADMYSDLMDEFCSNGHKVYIVSPVEKKEKSKSFRKHGKNYEILGVNIGNYFNVGTVEKGMTLITLEKNYLRAIQHFWNDVKFDLILYSTPPITFNHIIQHFKKQGVSTYLMLKDIFPQNAVDIGMMSKNGIKGFLYRYFRSQEKKLYHLSDAIGCMSQANVDYVLEQNTDINPVKVGLCPNAVKIRSRKKLDGEDKAEVRRRYGIPNDKIVFLYGGNLGLPQGPDFILKCLAANEKNEKSFILIVGSGSEYGKFDNWFKTNCPSNSKLISYLPVEEYMSLVAACDVGLIFLDYRFTIPNFPSRLLSYMELKTSVLAATDLNTDVGKVIKDAGFGYWCESNDSEKFIELVNLMCNSDLAAMGERAYQYLEEHYTVEKAYEIIMKHMEKQL